MTLTPAGISPDELAAIYTDLHSHPELSFVETRTAALVAERLTALGYAVTTGIGGTGVVGVLENGPGPTVLLRADMDALPVAEATGLPYASTVVGLDRFGIESPVMHACGHDVHVTCLLGAAATLSTERDAYSGTLVVLFQPAEESGGGASAMVADGLYDRIPIPDVVMGQHVAPLPAGMVALPSGVALAAADSLKITLHGQGGHGSRPETTVDPVVMAAATIMRLQTIVSRETAGNEMVVLSIGQIAAGSAPNIIPSTAELRLNIRTVDPEVRTRTLAAVDRIVQGETIVAGAPQPAEVEITDSYPALVNDADATVRVRAALGTQFGAQRIVDPGAQSGSEDCGILAEAAGAPCVFWFLGGADPTLFAGAGSVQELMEILRGLPSNHSPYFAPVIEPTLQTGVAAMVAAAHEWMPVGV